MCLRGVPEARGSRWSSVLFYPDFPRLLNPLPLEEKYTDVHRERKRERETQTQTMRNRYKKKKRHR